MIRHLSQNHELFVASVAHTQEELDEGAGLKQYCAEIYAEVVPEKIRWLQAVRALPTPTPSSVAYFSSSRLRQRVKEASQRISFDTVIVHCAFAAQHVLETPARFRIMDFGDLDSGKWFDYGKWRAFPLRYAYALEAQKLRSYEKKIAQSFDYCTLTTQGELEEFKKLRVARPYSVIPNGVDTFYFSLNGSEEKGRAVVAFVGRMDYFPNIDGVLYFTTAILPLIRRQISNIEFRIVGSNPTNEIRKLSKIPGITVTGHVNDVRPFLQDASVSIAPLRIARGTQNKILESMAMGIPVVATPQAGKGIQASAGQHLLVGSDPATFAEHVIQLLKSSESRWRLSQAARDQIEEAHAWPRSMATFDQIFNRSRMCSTANYESL